MRRKSRGCRKKLSSSAQMNKGALGRRTRRPVLGEHFLSTELGGRVPSALTQPTPGGRGDQSTQLPVPRWRRSIPAMSLYPLADLEVLSVLMRSVFVIVAIAAAFWGVRYLVKWMKTDDISDIGAGFTLSELRRLHKSGQMSLEEFEKAKAILLAASHKPTEGANSTDRPPL